MTLLSDSWSLVSVVIERFNVVAPVVFVHVIGSNRVHVTVANVGGVIGVHRAVVTTIGSKQPKRNIISVFFVLYWFDCFFYSNVKAIHYEIDLHIKPPDLLVLTVIIP